jgi:hypothetical protein
VRIIEALRKRRRQAGGPNGPGRGTGDKEGEKTRDPERKLGLLMDLLAPYQGETATNGVARPAPGRPTGLTPSDGDTAEALQLRRPIRPMPPAEPIEAAPPAEEQAEDREAPLTAPSPAEAACAPNHATPRDSSGASDNPRASSARSLAGPDEIGDLARREPTADVGRNATNEPNGSGLMAMAGLGVPPLVCALLIMLATGLSAAFAGPVAGPIGRPSTTPAVRAGPAVRVGPFPRRRYRLDDAGRDVGRALRSTKVGASSGNARIPREPFVPVAMNPEPLRGNANAPAPRVADRDGLASLAARGSPAYPRLGGGPPRARDEGRS